MLRRWSAKREIAVVHDLHVKGLGGRARRLPGAGKRTICCPLTERGAMTCSYGEA